MRSTTIALVVALVAGAGCSPCSTDIGYGRYTLRIDCDKVRTTEGTYAVTREGDRLMLGGEPLERGIRRSSYPWLYVHEINDDNVVLTFDEGRHREYPLYTGSLFAIFSPFGQPHDVALSSIVKFDSSRWMVLHRWSGRGIHADLLQAGDQVEQWTIVHRDILIAADGAESILPELRAKARCTAFDPDAKTATVVFTSVPRGNYDHLLMTTPAPAGAVPGAEGIVVRP